MAKRRDMHQDYGEKQQIPEYDLRPQLKPSAAANRREKSDTVSDMAAKKYDI